jgi:hypothetical protein
MSNHYAAGWRRHLPSKTEQDRRQCVLSRNPPPLTFSKWNIPQRLRDIPNRVGENAHFRALLRWRTHMTLMARQLLGNVRIAKCE